MSNKRSADQKMLIFPAQKTFIDVLDRALRSCGYSNRSQFIRDAIGEKLNAEGIAVPKELLSGAGRYPGYGASSARTCEAKEISERAEAAGAHLPPGSMRSRAVREPIARKGRPSGGASSGTKGKPSLPG